MLRQTQQQKLVQKLSPQQIQLMKLLQVPTANLEERIKDELESNPALDYEQHEDNNDPYDFDEDREGSRKEEEGTDTGDDNIDDYLQMDITDYLRSESDEQSDYHVREDHDDEEQTTIPIKVETTFHDY